jgi:hypothetical protein
MKIANIEDSKEPYNESTLGNQSKDVIPELSLLSAGSSAPRRLHG